MAYGWLSKAEQLRDLLSECSTFQTVVGAANATAAKDSIAQYAAVEEYYPLPRAIVHVEDVSWTNQGIANWVNEGTLMLSLEFLYALPADSAAGINTAYEAFIAHVQAIIQEMTELSGQGEPVAGSTHLHIREIRIVEGPYFRSIHETELVDPSAETQQGSWWINMTVVTF